MKKISLPLLLFLLMISLTGCGAKDTWQGVYYEHGMEENELYGPIFDNFDACKSWVLGKKSNSDDTYHCIKNCHKALEDGTPICETVVRDTELFPGSDTFDNYKK